MSGFLCGCLSTDILVVFTTVFALVYAYFKWSYQYWKRRNVPYLEPVFPVGNAGNPFDKNNSMVERITTFYEIARKRGWRHCGVYFLAKPTYICVNLDILKHVMTKDFSHFVDRGTYYNEKDDPISASLFAIGGTKWRNLRMKLTPTFTSGKMKSMFHTLAECGTILESYIEDRITKDDAVDIKNVLGHFSTDIIGTCAFGIECNSFKDENSPFRVHTKKLFGGQQSVLPFIRPLKSFITNNYPDLGRKLKIKLFPDYISSFFTKVIEDTMAYRKKNNVRRKDLLQLLIDSQNEVVIAEGEYKGDGKSLTTAEIVAQSFLFFLAGFETSSTTMTFTLFNLATHQDIQDRVRKEIVEVLEKHDNKITYDSLSEMKYMQQVIDETLRLFTPVPFVTRECIEDWKVPGEDIIIEKGTRMIIPMKGLHHDPEYYKNPDEFDPERFNEENKRKIHQYAHIPFGEGPRVCIGERFGIMVTKVGLTTILKNFKVTLNKKTIVPLRIPPRAFIPFAEGGIWLNLKKL